MATYTMLSNGSSGSEVKKLQTALINAGYNVGSSGADGIYGSNTAAAVKAYQQANGLDVDGIAGDQTLGKLYGSVSQPTTSATPTAPTTPAQTTPAAAATQVEQPKYQESDTVKQAQALLQQQMAQKPGEYQSQWQSQLDAVMDKILNREKFSYDMNADALYQQYKGQATTQGKQASMDVMGQAAALTGGYGNSYAQTVGQQTYQGYLQNLNDKIPELYQLAMDQYNQEGDALIQQYGMYADREEQDYGRYRDQVGDYNTELDYLTGRYDAERDYDYGKYADDRAYQYQLDRDKKADEQWQAEFDEAKRQYDQEYALANGSASGGSSGGSSGSSSDGYYESNDSTGGNDSDTNNDSNGGLTKSQIKALQKKLGVDADGIVGPQTLGALKGMSLQDAYDKYVGNISSYTPSGSALADINNTNTSSTPVTYSEAVSYMKRMGVDNAEASNMMTASEWQRMKNHNSKTEAATYATYKDYISAYVEFAIENYGVK